VNFFSRIRILWIGFWSSLLGNTEQNHQHLVNEGILKEQRAQLEKLRQAITQLIFQKKQIRHRTDEISEQLAQLKADLEQAALAGKDELAVHLIEKSEALEEENTFLMNHYAKLKEDLFAARETEKTVLENLEKMRYQLNALASRSQALKMRKKLKSQLQGTGSVLAQTRTSMDAVHEQIHKLEAENEALSSHEEAWEKELKQFRKERKKTTYDQKLSALKAKLNQRLLPQQAAIISPLKTT
jgi:phage shock protein A